MICGPAVLGAALAGLVLGSAFTAWWLIKVWTR